MAILGDGFPMSGAGLPKVRLGELPARVVFGSPQRIDVIVPAGFTVSGSVPVSVEGVQGDSVAAEIAAPLATDLHQIDNPIFDRDGNLYVTYSGTRGEKVPVSIFRIRPNGARETFCSQIVNPTSMALDRDGQLYVSSRFEGTIYRVDADGSAEPFITEMGIACGLAFAPDGTLFVGDRSGTIFRVTADGRAESFVSLPPSVAAFHLALAPDGALYVTGPTLSTYDPLYRIEPDGTVHIRSTAFGRPQGIAFDPSGMLYVADALAGAGGVYRVPAAGQPELVVAGSTLVGLAFQLSGTMVVCSGETAYRFH